MNTSSNLAEDDFSDFKRNDKEFLKYMDLIVDGLSKETPENKNAVFKKLENGEKNDFEKALDRIENKDEIIEDPLKFFIESITKNALILDPHKTLYHMLTSTHSIAEISHMVGEMLNENFVSSEVSKIGTTLHKRVSEQILDFIGISRDKNPNAMSICFSGGSEANKVAIKLALNEITRKYLQSQGENKTVRELGLQGIGKKLKILVPDTSHYSLESGIDLIGIGTDNILDIKTENFESNAADLDKKLTELPESDLAVCVVSVFGTTRTGSCDNVVEIAKVIEKHKKNKPIWWHVDAAYGGPFLSLDQFKDQKEAISKADSVTIDAHKHLWTPYEAGFLCVKDVLSFRNISTDAPYIGNHTNGMTDQEYRDTQFDHVGGISLVGSRNSAGVISTYSMLNIVGTERIKSALMQTLLMTDILKKEIEKQEEYDTIKIKVVGNPKLNVIAFKPDIGDIDKENKIVSGIHKYLREESPNGNNVSKTDLYKGENIFANRMAIMSPITNEDDIKLFVKTYRDTMIKVMKEL